MSTASIDITGLRKTYGDVVAVDDVSLKVTAGTLVTMLGPSGCGKTTMLRLIAGLETPDAGRLHIGGADITRLPASQRNVSMVFQSYALFPHMTVAANVAYGLVVSAVDRGQIAARTRAMIDMVGLAGLDARRPSELSGGQQQRVALARALVLQPAVLLFDEPLSNLDARLRRQMRNEIRDLQQRLQLTVVYVTHDQTEAMAISDRIVVMDRGRIAQQGSPRELYERPCDVFVASFMGEANRVLGVLSVADGDATYGTIALGPLTLRVPHRGIREGRVEIAVRPESIHVNDPNHAGMKGRIRKSTYIGALVEYAITTELGELFAIDTRMEPQYAEGASVSVTFAARGVIPVSAA